MADESPRPLGRRDERTKDMDGRIRLVAMTRAFRDEDAPLWDATQALEQATFDSPDFSLEDMGVMARLHHTGMSLGDIAWVFGVEERHVRAMILLFAHAELLRREQVATVADTP